MDGIDPPIGLAPETEKQIGAGGMLAALGIVFGDLGTSPLYTYQTLISTVGGHPSADIAIGLLSLVVWSLLLTISVKYCLLVMRADNHGEGGILALMSLVTRLLRKTYAGAALTAMGLFGAALIYGDGAITPAISVLSALEGINVADAAFKPYVLPAALAVLLALFAVQPFGTAKIGRVFGPIMLLWFITIGALGLLAVLHQPRVVTALNPLAGLGFLLHHGWQSFIVLGGVFLAVTGGEALYADMGHIGRKPIRGAWYGLVLPALLLSYAGQTALLIQDPGLDGNPFFRLAPAWGLVPLVILSTCATIIASQAIITGAFSLTRQAMQLGWFPGLNIRQTSDTEYGQIYVPTVNWLMMIGTLALAAGFGSSDRLAGAYGTAVSTTMLLTTVLLFTAMQRLWKWPLWLCLAITAVLLAIDLAFFGANMLKLLEGGWIPLVLGLAIYVVMTTWHAGLEAVHRRLDRVAQKPGDWIAGLTVNSVPRVPGTAVFLSRSQDKVPAVLIRHVEQFKALQETTVDLTVSFEEVPRIEPSQRARIEHVGDGIWLVKVRFGFMDVPNLPAALAAARDEGCPLELDDAVYFASRDAVVRDEERPRLSSWRRYLFTVLFRNSVRTPDRFDLPADRFVEITRQVAL